MDGMGGRVEVDVGLGEILIRFINNLTEKDMSHWVYMVTATCCLKYKGLMFSVKSISLQNVQKTADNTSNPIGPDLLNI